MNVATNGHKKKPDPTAGLDDGDRIAALMKPFYQQLASLAFGDANEIPGIDVSFSLENAYVQTVLAQLAKQVRNVTDTTKDDIKRLVGLSASEGWSNDELARQIRKTGADLSRSRSVTIARTESASAYTGGSIAAYQDSGVVSGTTWLMGPDSCDICQALDGTRADLGADYPGGFAGPPAHPHCTCVLQPVIE